MKSHAPILRHAHEIYCYPDETLQMLPRVAKIEAVRFCVANDVPVVTIASEFGVSIDQIREVATDVIE
jgi:hypothetical protein